MDEATAPPDDTGLSRRDMLRRSALVGGTMVWMTPAVQTLASPAFAAATTVGENPCLFSIFLKFTPTSGGGTFENSEGTGNASCIPPGPFEVPQLGAQSTVSGVTTVQLKRQDGSQLGTASASFSSVGDCVTLSVNGFSIDGSSSYWVIKDGRDKLPGTNTNDPNDSGSGCEVADQGTFSDAEASDGIVTRCDSADDRANLSHINYVLCVSANPA